MHSTSFLTERDRSLLSQLLHHQIPGLFPVPASINALTRLLVESGRNPADPGWSDHHVALGDEVTLLSPEDTSDRCSVSIVLPAESDRMAGRFSVLTPLGMAVLGRRAGQTVSWETQCGIRRMTVGSILKPGVAPT